MSKTGESGSERSRERKMIRCCPECGSHDVYGRGDPDAVRAAPNRIGDERYRCMECGHRFEEMAYRRSNYDNAAVEGEHKLSGLPRRLEKADPEEWP